MKKRTKRRLKRTLMIVFGLLAVAAISVGATIAYLTDSAVANNTFTVGHVKITLDEAPVDETGTAITGDSAQRVQENTYHLIPGEKYDKDPTIHVTAGSEDCWLFAKVENGIAGIEAKSEQTEVGYKSIADQIKENGWTPLSGVENVYCKEYTKPAKDAEDPNYDFVVFNEFKISGDVDNKTLEAAGDTVIKITGYAVQKAGFDTALNAWNETFGKPTT